MTDLSLSKLETEPIVAEEETPEAIFKRLGVTSAVPVAVPKAESPEAIFARLGVTAEKGEAPGETFERLGVEPAEEPNQFGLGLERGVYETGVSLGAGLDMLGSLTGIDALQEWGSGLKKSAREELYKLPLPEEGDVVKLWDKLMSGQGDAGDAANWLTYTLGNVGPSMASTVVGGIAGTLVGGPIGGLAGMGGISYLLNAGEVYSNLKDQGYDRPGAAAAAGIPMALLDVVTPGRVFGKVLWQPVKVAKRGIKAGVRRGAREALTTAGVEGVTEAVQEAIGAGTEAAVTGKDFLTPETASRMLNAFAAGAVAGGAMGAGGQVIVEARRGPVETIEEADANLADTTDLTSEERLAKEVIPRLPAEPPVEFTVEEESAISEKKRPPQAAANELVKALTPLSTGDFIWPLNERMLRHEAVAQKVQPLLSELQQRGMTKGQVEGLIEKQITKVTKNQSAEEAGLFRDRVMQLVNIATRLQKRTEPKVTGLSAQPDINAQVDAVETAAPGGFQVLVTAPRRGDFYTKIEVPFGKGTKTIYEIEAVNAQDAAERVGHLWVERWIDKLAPKARREMEAEFVADTRENPSEVAPTFGAWVLANVESHSRLRALKQTLHYSWQVNGIQKPYAEWLLSLSTQTQIPLTTAEKAAVPTPARVGSEHQDVSHSLQSLAKDVKKLENIPEDFDDFDGPEEAVVQTALDKSSWLSRNMLTLPQFGERNPHIKSLQSFIAGVREFWADKTFFTSRAIETRDTWLGLSVGQQDKLTRALFAQRIQSYELNRRLTPVELMEIRDGFDLSPATRLVADQVDTDFQTVIQQFKEQSLANLDRLAAKDVDAANDLAAKIEADYAILENRHYFPLSRFGKYTTIVTAKNSLTFVGKAYRKGATVFRQQYASRRERKNDFESVKKRFSGLKYAVSQGVLEDNEYAFQGFPPSLLAAMEGSLDLTEEQKTQQQEMFIRLSPGAGWTKHMLKSRGIAGFSEDGPRVYTDYMHHASNHFARLKHYRSLAEDINAVGKQVKAIIQTGGDYEKRQLIKQHMDGTYKYLMNPGNEAAEVRSFVFKWFFVGNARQLLVNLTQVPLFTYGYLAAEHGDIAASTALGKTYFDVLKSMGRPDRLTDSQSALLEQGIRAGFIDESLAMEAAAAGHGEGLTRQRGRTRLGQAVGKVTDMGLWPFKWSEGINRRVSFLAAIRLAEAKGITDTQALFEIGRDAVEKTQFEYARWARMPIARGGRKLGAAAPVMFMFKSYLQGTLYFYATQPGRGRALVALLGLAGIMGLPGAEDVADIINFLVTKLGQGFGWKDPHVEVRKWLRDGIAATNANPDLVMHGMSRHTIGVMNLMTGLPVPSVDLSQSVSLGRVVPGVRSVTSLTARPTERVGRAIQDVSGVAGGMAVNWGRALFSSEFADWQRAMPTALKGPVNALYAKTQGGYTDSKGNKLLPIEPNNNEHNAELFALAFLNAQPTRLQQRRGKDWARYESKQYYLIRRELVLKDLAFATIAKDQEAKADALKALRIYNNIAPVGFKISYRDMKRSLESRIKNRTLRERGLPSVRRYAPLYRSYDPGYPVDE